VHDTRREQRVREVIADGLEGCPPMAVATVRELARLAGERHGVPKWRVDQLLDEEVETRP
jgi:hypothetical protein